MSATGPIAAHQRASFSGVRRIANLVNLSTPLGLALARAGRARVAVGPDGLLLAEGYRWGFPIASAFTIGNVVITAGRWDQLLLVNPRLVDHEARHSTQWALLGPLFLPAYLAATARSIIRCGNRYAHNAFERAAGLGDGGYTVRPEPH